MEYFLACSPSPLPKYAANLVSMKRLLKVNLPRAKTCVSGFFSSCGFHEASPIWICASFGLAGVPSALVTVAVSFGGGGTYIGIIRNATGPMMGSSADKPMTCAPERALTMEISYAAYRLAAYTMSSRKSPSDDLNSPPNNDGSGCSMR